MDLLRIFEQDEDRFPTISLRHGAKHLIWAAQNAGNLRDYYCFANRQNMCRIMYSG